MRSAFREHIYGLASQGNPGSIGDFDVAVAGWETGSDHSVHVSSYAGITERLEDFSTNTREALSEITEVTGVPAYANDFIIDRYQLGVMAGELAGSIRSYIELGTDTTQLDEEFSKLLRQKPGDLF